MNAPSLAERWAAPATVIITIIGATWWLAGNMATKDDLAELRQEVQRLQEHVDAQMTELRGYIVDHLDGHDE